MNELGKSIFILGLAIAVAGLLLWSGAGRSWFGRLPGDIRYTRGGFTFYFPIATCVLLSAALSLLFWLMRGRK
jgi:hypothetical protein